MTPPGYVLITPARNEEAYIGLTIQSVACQTVRPLRWVIVDDGSEDRTFDIANSAARKYEFVQVVSSRREGTRNFGSKVAAFNAGLEQLRDLAYDFIGNLDADVSFTPHYYEQVLNQFQKEPQLGLAGGIIEELIGDRYVCQRISRDSVAGAVQFFRRDCFEAIGGYIPMKSGGIDAAAEISARMRGWQVRTFPELCVRHHRRVATGRRSLLSTRFHEGITNYVLGYHPAFQVVRSAYRILDRPFITGGVLMLAGYGWAWARQYERLLPRQAVLQLRSEQMARLGFSARSSAQR